MEDVAITSAHCVDRKIHDHIIFNTTDLLKQEGIIIKIKDVIIKEDYKVLNNINDSIIY